MYSFKSISQFLQFGTTKRFLLLLGKISVHCGVTPKYNSTITLLYPQPGLELRLLDPESTTLSMRPPPLSHSNNNIIILKFFFFFYCLLITMIAVEKKLYYRDKTQASKSHTIQKFYMHILLTTFSIYTLYA